LWGNTASTSGNEIYISDSGCSCTLNYSCVDNTGYGFGAGVPTTTIDDSNNCIFVDPQFVDAAGGDYHLQDTSPCIDNGDNSLVPSGVTTDLDGVTSVLWMATMTAPPQLTSAHMSSSREGTILVLEWG